MDDDFDEIVGSLSAACDAVDSEHDDNQTDWIHEWDRRREAERDIPLLEWVQGQLIALEAIADRIKSVAAERMARVTLQRDTLVRRWAERLKSEIEDRLSREGGKKRSFETALGKCGRRLVPAKLTIADMDAAVQWCIDNEMGEALKTTVGVAPLKDHWKSTGEIPDGTDLVPEEDAVFIEPYGRLRGDIIEELRKEQLDGNQEVG